MSTCLHVQYEKGNLQRHGSVSNISEDSGVYDDSDVDSLDIKCSCPCGSHNFRHCVQPPPECQKLRADNLFPELDLNEGANRRHVKIAQHYMTKRVLAEHVQEIKQKFHEFVIKLSRTLEEVTDIEKSLTNHLELQSGETVESSNYVQLFNQAKQGADFINYEPLEMIVKYCGRGNEAAEKLVEDYQEAFRVFAQHRVYSFTEWCYPHVREEHAVLKIKIALNFGEFCFKDIERFRIAVKTSLGLDDRTQLRLVSVTCGCVLITFLIPKRIACKKLSSDKQDGSGDDNDSEDDKEDGNTGGLTLQQKRELASHKISMLQCDGIVHYCCCSLFDDEVFVYSCKIIVHEIVYQFKAKSCP